MDEPNKTRAYIAVYPKDDYAYGFGCELMDNRMNEDYFISSLYLPRTEYPNIRQILYKIIPLILEEIPEDHVSVTFYSTLLQIRNRRRLIRENSRFAIGKSIDFKEVSQVRRTAINLAVDAIRRGNSITERV